MTACQKCPAEVRFITMIKKDGTTSCGIVDAQPIARGNIRVLQTAKNEHEGRVLGGQELTWARDAGERLYLSHFVTCPAAASFGKRAKR